MRRQILKITSRLFSSTNNNRPRILTKAKSINSSFTLSPFTQKPSLAGVNKLSLNADNEDDVAKDNRTLIRRLSNSLTGDSIHDSFSTIKDIDRWRKRPLFNRGGVQATFASGVDAANLLVQEARRKDPYQGDFLDAIEDIVYDLTPVFEEDPRRAWIFKNLMEPEYMCTFRIPWEDDSSNSRINRGFLVQFSGSSKLHNGDAFFSSFVSHGLARMLGWENNLRCALASKEEEDTLLATSFGGMMTGSDFDIEEKSETEIMSFCSSFVKTLTPLTQTNSSACLIETGPHVGQREMAFLKDAYDKNFGSQAIPMFGSSLSHAPLKGYGCVYFAQKVVKTELRKSLKDLKCVISGSGLLSRNIARKLIDLGANPICISDDTGILYAKHGFTKENLDAVQDFRTKNLSLNEFSKTNTDSKIEFIDDINLFRQERIQIDVVFAAKGMGEMNVDDATFLEDQDVQAVFECTHKGVTTNARMLLSDRQVIFAPAKAVVCGQAVATSYTSYFSQKEGREPNFDDLDMYVENRMIEIADEVSAMAQLYNVPGNLKAGANLLSFLRVAKRSKLY